MTVETLRGAPAPADLERLGALLTECVGAGASIGFVLPVTASEVASYWARVLGDAASGAKLVFVARTEQGLITGSAQLAIESRANGRHRAEVQKVMVFPELRRQGIAAALMESLEAAARGRGVSLLHLDTSEGRGGARGFYAALGYEYVGGIPGYAVDPDGTPAKNAIYYKTLT